MKQIIKTNSGEYSFKPIHLYIGQKKLVKKNALENIIILRNILNKTKISSCTKYSHNNLLAQYNATFTR